MVRGAAGGVRLVGRAALGTVYQKLGRVPLGLSEAWFAESTARVRPVYPLPAELSLPPSLQGLQVLVVDGKAIKRVAKRLKPLQGRKGGVLGGKALVALELRSGVVVAMATHAGLTCIAVNRRCCWRSSSRRLSR